VTTLSGIQTRILQGLDATYEKDFGDSVPDKELYSTHLDFPHVIDNK
jgi:hypothetical protein